MNASRAAVADSLAQTAVGALGANGGYHADAQRSLLRAHAVLYCSDERRIAPPTSRTGSAIRDGSRMSWSLMK